MILDYDLVIRDIGYKHTFTGSGFMIEFNWLLIKKGFVWDGASAGASDGPRVDGKPITWKATCLHDCLYRNANPLGRRKADTLFYREMKAAGFKRAIFYYMAVRLFGGFFYKGARK